MYPLTDLGHLKRVRCLNTGKGKLFNMWVGFFASVLIYAEQFSSLCYEENVFRAEHEKLFPEQEGKMCSLKL